eukprot:m.125088 g.125088  ORF g.125088 m.125088 type:complete len:119 (+) comp29105_c0_seq1:267-623(+)
MHGEYYTPPQPRPLLAQIIQFLYMSLLLVMATGDTLFQSFGIPTPSVFVHLRESQMAAMFFVYFVGNSLATGLMNSGAFEVTYNDQLVWSKLETGRLPTWPELITGMQAAGLPTLNTY